MTLHAKRALLPSGWARDVRITIKDGLIGAIDVENVPDSSDYQVDVLLPALSNCHSHAFQRAMAGMTEIRSANQDSFWTWRTLMYRFLQHLTPEHVEAIAALVYMEMLEAGYASVGEFHYVHHQPSSAPYARLSELSDRVFSAAKDTGIGLTHLPVMYQYGGVDGSALSGGQLRFGNDVERFLRLVADCEDGLKAMPFDACVGIAPHSLRAVDLNGLSKLVEARPKGPLHIHIAEQVQEVSDVKTALGQRPVAWLLDHMSVDERWCLIHATHMTDDEATALAKSGAVAGLCPITEANLGDGIFNAPAFLGAGGAFAVGSDSNVRIALGEELRLFEYSQRLRDRARNVVAMGAGSTGSVLYQGAAKGGAQSLGRNCGTLAIGKLADMVAIDGEVPALYALSEDHILDGLCFAANETVVTDVWSAGRHKVRQGRHTERSQIIHGFKRAMNDLSQKL